jgi:flagellin
MRINTNVASLTAQENATNTNKTLSSSLEKLSSGLRINKAADDASGLAIADKLRTQASSLGQGIANANSAAALIQIADKAMAEQSNILDTVKQKLIQASTSTTSADGREAIRKDINKLLTQFDNIAAQTNYNGTTLLQKSDTDTAKQNQLSFQLGEDSTFDVTVELTKASNTAGLGGGSDTVLYASFGDTATGGTNDGDNNIAVNGSKVINTSDEIILTDVNLDAAGAETIGTAAAASLDLDLSGELGKVISGGGGNFDLSSQTDSVKLAVEAIASATTNATYTASTGTLTLAAGASIDFGSIDFTATQFQADGAGDSLQLNLNDNDVNITIEDNNTGTDTPLLGQININGGGAMTGGYLMSDIKDLTTDGLTAALANTYMATVDEALSQMNTNRSDFGSTQNQLESSIRNMQTTQTNLKNAESVIRDVDYASESASFNKQNIIAQAGTYAMSQANAMQQNVMRLLQ